MKQASKITFLSSLGAALEYYDFMIYGLLVPFLTPHFFSTHNNSVGLAKAFYVFALGYIARPLGGLLFGLMADRKGRRPAFTIAMFVMAFATLLIGLLPTTESIGGAAAWLLVICRLLQGVSFGAEMPGAMTVVSEFNEPSVRGLRCGLVISSTSIGAVLATLVLTILTTMMPTSQIAGGGWRLPFMLGGLLAVVSFLLRYSMHETPEFTHIQNSQRHKKYFAPLLEALRSEPASMMLGIGLMLFPAALIITNIYFAVFLVSNYHYESSLVYQGMTVALLAAALMVPVAGWIVDQGKRLFLSMLAALLFLALGYPLFSLLNQQTGAMLLTFLVLWQVFIATSIASALPSLTEIFPTAVRFTAVSICYNLAYVLSSLLPNLYTSLMTQHRSPLVVFYVLASIAGVSFISALALRMRGQG